MKPVAEIFSQGEELINGQIQDSNAAWLSIRLNELGFRVRRHTAVGDDLADLIELFREIAARADCCICTGGLGPTVDDLTAKAVSLATDLPLHCDEQSMLHLQHYFSRRGRMMPEANRKQAYLPETAERIVNPLGTAPGFGLQFQRCWFVFLPGVPKEMQRMFDGQVKQSLQQRYRLQPDEQFTLHCLGLGESTIQQQLTTLKLPQTVKLGFRASTDEVQVKFVFPAGFPSSVKQHCIEQASELIGSHVYSIEAGSNPQGDLPGVINRLLLESGLRLSILETASMGLMASKCAARPWLHSADICVDQQQLRQEWSIEPEENDLQPVAIALAARLRERRLADLALVQIFAVDPLTHAKGSGSISLHSALSTPNEVFYNCKQLFGEPKHKQNQAALLTLDLLRRYLQNLCP